MPSLDGIPHTFLLALTRQDVELEDYDNGQVISFGDCGATQVLELKPLMNLVT